MDSLTIDGIEIPVERKHIRNLYIRFSPADRSVKITAPLRMSSGDIAAFARSKAPWLHRQMQRAESYHPLPVSELPPDAEAILRQRMEALIPECEAVVGQHASGWRIRSMKTRWGSCSRRTGIISINLQLVLLDDETLKYILIHELTHFWVANHGVYFKNRMDRYFPQWKTVRKKLNRTV
ncbi:MAG: M48 family metallopeptidase [Lachnospiraceae bacterium]|jgi:predicted metal-dependent hydrolase|nr:M48 family metallopeptidase [Lachnospiraceae bacterium]